MNVASGDRHGRRDPWWDLEGTGIRRTRAKRRVVSGLAFVTALAACGGAAFAWAITLGFVGTAAIG